MSQITVPGLEAVPDTPRDQTISYLSEKNVQQLFECLTAGLLHHKPEDPVAFVQEGLLLTKAKDFSLKWNTFIEWKPPAKSRPNTGKDGQK